MHRRGLSSVDEMGDVGMSEYEKHRIARISENKARLEALGLPHLASSVLGSSSKQQAKPRNLEKRKGKRRVAADDDEDEEYRPEVDGDDDDGGEEEADDYIGESSSAGEEKGRRRQASGQKKSDSLSIGKVKESSYPRKSLNQSDILDDEAALKQAIALSLGVTAADHSGVLEFSHISSANLVDSHAQGKRGKAKSRESSGKKKIRKLEKNRIRLTEDEVVAYFFSFDEAGKGYITPRDLRRMVSAHDFTWTDSDISHMICSFDSNGDGKLSLEDFQNIVSRCNMMKGSLC